jgi:hypothetical protein
MVVGKMKNSICLMLFSKVVRNFSKFCSANASLSMGKLAMAMEIPKIPIGTACKLLAKFKIAIEPEANKEPITEPINKLICELSKPRILGTNSLMIFKKAVSLKFIIGCQVNPELKTAGT